MSFILFQLNSAARESSKLMLNATGQIAPIVMKTIGDPSSWMNFQNHSPSNGSSPSVTLKSQTPSTPFDGNFLNQLIGLNKNSELDETQGRSSMTAPIASEIVNSDQCSYFLSVKGEF